MAPTCECQQETRRPAKRRRLVDWVHRSEGSAHRGTAGQMHSNYQTTPELISANAQAHPIFLVSGRVGQGNLPSKGHCQGTCGLASAALITTNLHQRRNQAHKIGNLGPKTVNMRCTQHAAYTEVLECVLTSITLLHQFAEFDEQLKLLE